MKIRFGPSGLPDLGGLQEGLQALKKMGFDACEFDFVREFWMDKEMASGARVLVEDLGLSVRAHAPFYGVLSQDDPKKVRMAVAMMHHTANLVHIMGGEGITVHPGFYMGRSREKVMEVVEKRLGELEERLTRNGIDDIPVGVENMGNRGEFGGPLEDILDICSLSDTPVPMIDWGHLQATSDGSLEGPDDFLAVLGLVEDRLGRDGLEATRHQFSQVEYSDGMERKHVAYDQGDMRLEDLLEALEETGLSETTLISESPSMEDHRKMLGIVRAAKEGGVQ
jgi:deoxyribonuclease-4